MQKNGETVFHLWLWWFLKCINSLLCYSILSVQSMLLVWNRPSEDVALVSYIYEVFFFTYVYSISEQIRAGLRNGSGSVCFIWKWHGCKNYWYLRKKSIFGVVVMKTVLWKNKLLYDGFERENLAWQTWNGQDSGVWKVPKLLCVLTSQPTERFHAGEVSHSHIGNWQPWPLRHSTGRSVPACPAC